MHPRQAWYGVTVAGAHALPGHRTLPGRRVSPVRAEVVERAAYLVARGFAAKVVSYTGRKAARAGTSSSGAGAVQGRARVVQGDCVVAMDRMPAASIDSIVCDPPYGLGFRGLDWDAATPGLLWARAALRVVKPGSHLLAFSGTRTVHALTTALDAAGWEIRDMLQWVYWSGLNKSQSIDVMLDRMRHTREEDLKVTAWLRSARVKRGISSAAIDRAFGLTGMAAHWTTAYSQPLVPNLEQVPQLLDILGVKLEDMPEDIRVLLWDENQSRGEWGNPREDREMGDRAENTSIYGTNPNNVINAGEPVTEAAARWRGWGTAIKPCLEPIVLARKPLEKQTIARQVVATGTGALNIAACRFRPGDSLWPGPNDGTKARDPGNIIQCKKASRKERDRGTPAPGGKGSNAHPTVKPVRLLRWLCRLVTPPGGVLLDTFAGSGSCGVAAVLEGFAYCGIEQVAGHCVLARSRVQHAAQYPEAWEDTGLTSPCRPWPAASRTSP